MWSNDFQQGIKTIQQENDSLLNKWCQENWISTSKRTKFNPYLTPYPKIHSIWTKHLNVRAKAIKFLEENIGQKLHNTGFDNDFLDMTPKVQARKGEIDKLDFMKIKNVYSSKYMTNRVKRQPTERKKILTNHICDNGLLPKIYRELLKLNNKTKPNNPIQKQAKDSNRYFSKEDIQMPNKHMKRCSTSLIVRSSKSKPQ